MANITLAIPDNLHRKMKKHNDVRWSSLVRNIIEERIGDLEVMNRIMVKSSLTEKDVAEISARIDKAVSKKLGLVR